MLLAITRDSIFGLKKDVDGELQVGSSWRKMKVVAQDRAEWRQVVCSDKGSDKAKVT